MNVQVAAHSDFHILKGTPKDPSQIVLSLLVMGEVGRSMSVLSQRSHCSTILTYRSVICPLNKIFSTLPLLSSLTTRKRSEPQPPSQQVCVFYLYPAYGAKRE